MTRREIIVGAGALAASPSLGSVVRSLVGAGGTNYVSTAGILKNPYVTDGLIAMYDGEWNAGIGLHNPHTPIWADISGNGYDLTINGNRAAWSSNALFRTASERKDYSWTNYMAYRTTSIPECQSYECVFLRQNYTDDGADGECIVNPFPTAWQTTVLRVFNNRVSAGRNRPSSMGAPYVPIENGVIFSASAAFSGSGSTKYPTRLAVNGMPFSAGQTVNSSTYVRTSGFTVGENQWGSKTTKFTFWGSIFCIRVYNRVITEEEMEYNLSVDAERFGI